MTAQAPTPTEIRDAWDAIADRFDDHATPYTMAFGEQVLSALPLGSGVRLLDVGSGCGAISIPAARRGADVVAVDVAPKMIERLNARAEAEKLSNLTAEVGDGTALELDDDSFDLAVSLNGVSLFPDLEGGLAELVRVTRPGGEVVITTFGPLPQVEFIAFFVGALRATAPDVVPPATQSLPAFRLADPEVLRRTLAGAGLRDVAVDTLSWEMQFRSVDHFVDFLLSGNPIAGQLTGRLSDEQFAQFRQVLDGMLRERSGGHAGATLQAEMRVGRGTV